MGVVKAVLIAYFLGGITFLPLLVIAILVHAHYTFPYRPDVDDDSIDAKYHEIVDKDDDTTALDAEAAKEKKKKGVMDSSDVAAGFFAVCREYTPMGINAKPIERSTPVGSTTVAAPSQSVYQTMYKSIFDRKQAPPNGQTDYATKSQRPKKAGNVFYIVLRHGHIMLFDDEEQLEVRHVISLAHHDISIYSGGDVTPEGELFIKRNALCLSRKTTTADEQASKPFYLFSENCSAKEDFYFALLRNQEQAFSFDGRAPKPKQFDVKAIISLVQKLHSSEDNIHSRWFNAMLGRFFLGVYQTRDIEYHIAEKITKKISRVKTPSFLTNIAIRKIDTGTAAPYFSNMKLKDLTVEGECVTEADVKYTGNFRIEVAATAKIDLGARFKAREVNLVLSVMLKRVEGRVLFKIKPPPSNRIWFSFQTMPKMEMSIEPIVSTRQITYTVILRQIESRIKEVMAETLVQPFWDDIPFFRTEHKNWRGGIFEGDDAVVPSENLDQPMPPLVHDDEPNEAEEKEVEAETVPLEKSASMPALEPEPAPTGLFGRKLTGKSGLSTPNIDAKGSAISSSRSPNIVKNSVEPVVGTEAAHADIFKPSSPSDNATNYMAALHSRAQEMSPMASPVGSPEKGTPNKAASRSSDSSKVPSDNGLEEEGSMTPSADRRNTVSSTGSVENLVSQSPSSSTGSFQSQVGSIGRNFFLKRENTNATTASTDSATQKKITAAMSNAAAQARQWGWNAIQRQKEAMRPAEPLDLSQPMGRGQPLPPPGMPLPRPTNGTTKISPAKETPKKPAAEHPPTPAKEEKKEQAPPMPPRRRRGTSLEHDEEADQPMLVVAIPADSQPSTPAATEDGPEILGGAMPPSPTPPSKEVAPEPSTNVGSSPLPIKTAPGAEPRSRPEETLSSTPDSLEMATEGGESVVALPAGDMDDDFSPWMDDDGLGDVSDVPQEDETKEVSAGEKPAP